MKRKADANQKNVIAEPKTVLEKNKQAFIVILRPNIISSVE